MIRHFYKWFFATCTVTAIWSCQKIETDNKSVDDKVAFSITAGIQNEIATYASDQGGVANVDKDTYDQRYILEVYDGDTRVYRETKNTEIGESTTFEVRLLAKKYTFALWADFTPNESQDDNIYNTANGLAHVTYKDNTSLKTLSNDLADAYCYTEEIDLTQAGQNIKNVLMKRPFGKIRFFATDQFDAAQQPLISKISFSEQNIPTGYNVLNGSTDGAFSSNELFFEAVPEKTLVNGSEKEGYLLGNIYVFANTTETTYQITISTFADEEMETKIGERTSEIPLETNKLITVIGDFLD